MEYALPPNHDVANALLQRATDGGLSWELFQNALASGGCTKLWRDVGALQDAVARFEGTDEPVFWSKLVPFACQQSLRFGELFEGIPIVDAESCQARDVSRVVEWSQAQCLCILCNAFLCAWPGRTSRNCRCIEADAVRLDLPSINFDEMLCARGNRGAQQAKCEMFLHYLLKQYKRVHAGDRLERKLRFVRRKVQRTTDHRTGTADVAASAGVRLEPNWTASAVRLRPVVVRGLLESIDEAKDMLRADFANESIGGGSIAYGCVQATYYLIA